MYLCIKYSTGMPACLVQHKSGLCYQCLRSPCEDAMQDLSKEAILMCFCSVNLRKCPPYHLSLSLTASCTSHSHHLFLAVPKKEKVVPDTPQEQLKGAARKYEQGGAVVHFATAVKYQQNHPKVHRVAEYQYEHSNLDMG